jgi:RHS repeat-associated protein
LGTNGSPTSILDLSYSYGTTGNNGNVQSITYAGGGLSYTQSFTYDALNRLATSQENSGSNWSQTNGYDQYGNRWIDYGGGSHNLSFSSTTNRITSSGFSYDSAGNLTNDTIHAYTFDAENKILKVDSVSAYVYDGEGQRVRKLVGENTRFIYGIGGQLVAEFDGSNGNLRKEYVQGGATSITIEPTAVNSNGTRYTTSDNLGSPRVVTNSSAGVSRHDFMPFGEELGASVGGRTTGMGFSVTDGLRQKFTQKERDNETGLDFFEARYYSSMLGRFTSADSWAGRMLNPQTLNSYSYVRNNPLKFVDPTGHQDEVPQKKRGKKGGNDPEICPDCVVVVNINEAAQPNLPGPTPKPAPTPTPAPPTPPAPPSEPWIRFMTTQERRQERRAYAKQGPVALGIYDFWHSPGPALLALPGLFGEQEEPASLTGEVVDETIVAVESESTATTAESILMPGGRPIGTAGTSEDIRVLQGGLTKGQSFFNDLTKGGQITGNPRYPGTQVRMPNGDIFGFRTVSTSGSAAAIDVKSQAVPGIRKIHFPK